MKLADISCSAFRFEPGDRVLVRCDSYLTSTQRDKIYKAVKRWVGKEVTVMIIPRELDLTIEHQKPLR